MSVIPNVNDDATGYGNMVEDAPVKMDDGRTPQAGGQQGQLRQDGGRQRQIVSGGGKARCPRTFCQLPCTQKSQTPEEDMIPTYLNESDAEESPESWLRWKAENEMGSRLFTSCSLQSHLMCKEQFDDILQVR